MWKSNRNGNGNGLYKNGRNQLLTMGHLTWAGRLGGFCQHSLLAFLTFEHESALQWVASVAFAGC